MTADPNQPVPTRFPRDQIELIDALAKKHHSNRSRIIAAAVRAALVRARQGDVAWLLDPDAPVTIQPSLQERLERIEQLLNIEPQRDIHPTGKKKTA